MSYQNPQILYFLFAIVIPIFIHLFNLRKHKVVYFSNITFLKEIKSDKKKRNTIKQLLILLSRILAISAIVFAFANPYIPNNSEDISTNNTVIYIDNSFSMDNVSEKGRLLDIAKENALEIINSSNKTNQFSILTNNFSATENYPKNKKDSEEFILNIKSSSKIRSTDNILDKTKSISPEDNTLYIISDFQKSSTNLNSIQQLDTNISVVLIPLEKNSKSNISIDSCYLNSPINKIENTISLSTIISNHSDREIEDVIVNLSINNTHKTQQNIFLLANESKTIELNFTSEKTKINNGLISIEDHPITYDNNLYFSFRTDEKIDILQIYESENTNISKVFSSEETFNYTTQNIHQINYNILDKQDLIILNQINNFSTGFSSFIKSYIEKGGSICVIPSENANIVSYNSFLKQLNTNQFSTEEVGNIKISTLNLKNPIFNSVFSTSKIKNNINLPSVSNYYKLQENSKIIKENIFRLENSDEFLNSYRKEKIHLFSSPLSEGNNTFSKHALFVTTLFNMGLNSVKTDDLYYIINQDLEIKLPKTNPQKENIFHLQSEDLDLILENNPNYLLTHNKIKNASHYKLLQEDQILQTISFNYNRSESNIEQFTEEELDNFITLNKTDNVKMFSSDISINQNMENINKNKEFWKVLVLLSLLFITIEILLIKTIKT
ncbi:MAG: BatA domain-containing protein [Flavobacteriales bacterium]|nr:BatA domain-containing protein [Flavobacteriales bacterium]